MESKDGSKNYFKLYKALPQSTKTLLHFVSLSAYSRFVFLDHGVGLCDQTLVLPRLEHSAEDANPVCFPFLLAIAEQGSFSMLCSSGL